YMEQGNIQNTWDLTKKYAEQSAVARQTQVKSYYCPSRRGPTGFSIAEDFDSADNTPPPNFTYTGTVQPRFTAAKNPPAALGDYAACVGDMRGNSNNPSTPQWFAVTANGAIILGNATNNNTSFESNTTLTSISDGTSNTFLAGEKH